MVARFLPSDSERQVGAFSDNVVEQVCDAMRTDGALILERVIGVPLVVNAREAFLQTYAHYLSSEEHQDALIVGDKRMMVTIGFEPPFDRSDFFANRWLLPILKAVFKDEFVLGGYGVVCSLPGANSQHRHRDGGILFRQSGLDGLLPVTAVTVAIPLLEMNEVNGTTTLWIGSHRNSDHSAPGPHTGEEPRVTEGSCLLWDYRLFHGGTANRGTFARPLLYLTYCRQWFLDHHNYREQPPLRAPKQWLSKLSDENRQLLARATAPWLPDVLA